MRSGAFEAAWRITDEIEAPRRAIGGRSLPDNLLWDGTPVTGQPVIIRCQHGLGDSIQFLRYLPLVVPLASEVSLDVQPELWELYEGMPGVTLASTGGGIEVECMELRYLFRTHLKTISPPFVPVDTARFTPIHDRRTLNVGLIWASGAWDASRSMNLSELAPLRDIPNVRFYSLQQGPEAGKWRASTFELIPLHLSTAQIAAAAAAMLQLDLIVTVDSMTAHLAGALDRPVWTLLPHRADWRWMENRDDSPWYPVMRLYRQPAPERWDDVARRVAKDLAALAATACPESDAIDTARIPLL